MSTAICPAFTQQIPDIVATLGPTVADVPTSGRRWVFYGSLPLGAGRAESDLDAMLLHDSRPGTAPHRRDATWDGRPVTVYVLSHDDLEADARDHRFGGYFALKLFSPHTTDRPVDDGAPATAAARFLGPLGAREAEASGHRGPWTADQVLAHAYLAFLDLYPDFSSYVARLVRDTALLDQVWTHQREAHLRALAATGAVRATPGGWRYAEGTADVAVDLRDRCTARFWAFGAVCHGSDAGFPDLYFSKADARASCAERDAALGLLHAVAAGGSPC
ncbi:hypothetical protein [Cellulomonas sp. S1-8]|uniref:hypothetical protein n=1 Tax=Cellulomonas sp. S1-8 TaxID=2904790 RepID=UPI00224398E2|nr:hypothetical protein [Cellulomonas sp. S1-8]UZN03406.1 hypothetical protein OKX07_00220 [Cellulomonas sp. S1-8]